MKKHTKIILIVLAVIMILAMCSTAFAASATYSISNLAPNGGVLWSNSVVQKSGLDRSGWIQPSGSNNTGHMTVRLYGQNDRTTKRIDYMNVYATTAYNQTPFYTAWKYETFGTIMKFSNDTSTSVRSAGAWGVTTAT